METLKIRCQKKSIFLFLLVLTFALRAYTDAVYVAKELDSPLTAAKYGVLFLAIAYGAVYLVQRGKAWQCLNILKYVGLAALTAVFISFCKMIYVGVFSTAVLELAFHMLLPAIVTVLAMSICDSDDIYRCFSWILCVCFVIFCVFEIGLEAFTAEQFAQISFTDSFSPFESHFTSGTAMALCAYFSCYRKNRLLTILSLVFSLLVFKRLMVLFSLALFFLPIIIPMGKKLPRKTGMLCAAVFCVLTVGYYWCLIPENQAVLENVLGIESVADFTSTRSLFFESVYSDVFFVDFGWGSCEAALDRLLEMDLIQIYIELSVVGLVAFALSYWAIAGDTLYGIAYMGFNFLNMLSSHSIENGFIWIIVLITFAQIQTDTDKGIQATMPRIKFVFKSWRSIHD